MIKKKLRTLKRKRAMVETALQYLEERKEGKVRVGRPLKILQEKMRKDMTTQRLYEIIEEFRGDLGRLELAITAVEAYAAGQRRGPGRPPKRLQELLGRSRKRSSKRKGGEEKKAE